MWLLVVGVAVGIPLWRVYWAWDAKRFRRHAARDEAQLWYGHADVDGGHQTRCVHFPSMVLEEMVTREGESPKSLLFHVRRTEDGRWQRALTRQSMSMAVVEDTAALALAKAAVDERGWETFGDESLEEAYQRFLRHHGIEGPHSDGIPRRTTRTIKLPKAGAAGN